MVTTIHDPNMEKRIEKHMGGCMSGFFNIFDRSHRLYPKRLPSPGGDSASETMSCGESSAMSMEFEKPKPPPQQPELRLSTPEKESTPSPKLSSPASTWKFNREVPRLSLDSRAITDGKGGLRPRQIRINTVSNLSNGGNEDDDEGSNQRKSPSVIARLMGLEPLPSSVSSSGSGFEPEKKSELRRSASESRSRDYRFIDGSSFVSPANESAGERKLDKISVVDRQRNRQQINNNNNNNSNKSKNQSSSININNNNNKNIKFSNDQRKMLLEKRSYYDTTDFFPSEISAKQHHQPVSIYGEIERRLRTKCMEERAKDSETLKHILEALQLKGLLHSSSVKKPTHNRRLFTGEESPIVLMKPASRPTSPRRRNQNTSSGEPALSPRKERSVRNVRQSIGGGESRNSSPNLRRKGGPLGIETQRNGKGNSNSPVQSPRVSNRSNLTVNKSPRNRKSTVEIYQRDSVSCGPTFAEDEISTVSANSFMSTCSLTDNERWRVEEYKDGKILLERCDKLLNNIAEITAKSGSNSNSNSAELQQPSPVSVLDSSFYKEDESSPSPVKKRIIDFKDHQTVVALEDELWSPSSSSKELFNSINDIDLSEDWEFVYVSEVIKASNYLPDDENLFYLLEKHSSINGIGSNDKSKTSILQRKLIFDNVTEILERNRQLPPWKAKKRPVLEEVWAEFNKTREQPPSEDLTEVICGVLKKDLTRDSITGWTDFPVETSEAVLDIERLIFKDLIGESIRDLASLASRRGGVHALCRKLVF